MKEHPFGHSTSRCSSGMLRQLVRAYNKFPIKLELEVSQFQLEVRHSFWVSTLPIVTVMLVINDAFKLLLANDTRNLKEHIKQP